MSAAAKPAERRQNRKTPKKRFDVLLTMENYAYLSALADMHRSSAGRILNAILRRKPEPEGFTVHAELHMGQDTT